MNPPQARKTQPTVMDVWEWPEFRTLAQRLGIKLDADCMHLSIIMDGPSNPVQVVHKYACNDEGRIEKTTTYPPMVSDEGTHPPEWENYMQSPPQETMETHRSHSVMGECHGEVHVFNGMKIRCQCGKHSRSSPRATTPSKPPDEPDIIR